MKSMSIETPLTTRGRSAAADRPMPAALPARNARVAWFMAAATVALLAIALAATAIGPASISLSRVGSILADAVGWPTVRPIDPTDAAIVWQIRLPRVALGILAGMILGISGAVIQGLFRNPLAEPGLIGISNGAALAVVALTVLGSRFVPTKGLGGVLLQQSMAFGGGLFVTLVAYRLSRVASVTRVSILLLTGIAINALAASLIGLLLYSADDAQLRTIVFWMLGGLGGGTWIAIGTLTVIAVLATHTLFADRHALNALALGEAEAHHLGIDVERLKLRLTVLVALGVGGVVALCGVIAFVGLVVPHLVRLAVGADHRFLLPGSALVGAALMTLADLISRVIVAPQELPIGVVTALLGAPFFLGLILRERNRGGLA
jgi:iron complex transport system permease protein